MAGDAGAGVLGVEDRIDHQLPHVLVFQAVENRRLVPAGTSRAIRSFARCWETEGAGLWMCSASSFTDISRSASDHRTCTRVASASIRNTSTTKPT